MAKAIGFAMLLLAIGAITDSVAAADEELFTGCAPMNLLVEELDSEDTRATGLTTKAIENAAESRLRAARLFVPLEKQIDDQFLYIRVSIVGSAFSIKVELGRYLDNLGHGIGGIAKVWDASSTGTHGGNGQYILGSVSQHLDEFIASYLRANEEHCSR